MEKDIYNKIENEIKTVNLIGDIEINNDEYEILVNHMQNTFKNIKILEKKEEDLLLATALVNVGIRKYKEGKFWPYVEEISKQKLTGSSQKIIGTLFYRTLCHYNLAHLNSNNYVANILMHCFVTDNYADDFFFFLFMFYKKDLYRDLSNNVEEMKKHLIESMKRNENSSRKLKIKKGTADAAIQNETECLLKAQNILELIDQYMYENKLPNDHSKRINNLFKDWATKSKLFLVEKEKVSKSGCKRKKCFQTPYIQYDKNNKKFLIVLPSQLIITNEDLSCCSFSWEITNKDKTLSKTITTYLFETVTGYRTEETEIQIFDYQIFSDFQIELIDNAGNIIKKFKIQEDRIRFFDTSEMFLLPADKNNIKNFCAVVLCREEILWEWSDVAGPERYNNLDFYFFQNGQDSNYVIKPDGSIFPAANKIAGGLLESNVVKNVNAIIKGNVFNIYSSPPSICFSLNKRISENSLFLVINDIKYRLPNSCVRIFNRQGDEKTYYKISTKDLCLNDGLYNICLGVPTQKNKDFHFVLIHGFNYVFNTNGKENFYKYKEDGEIQIDCKNIGKLIPINSKKAHYNIFSFDTSQKVLRFRFNIENEIEIKIKIPIFSYKFSEDKKWKIKTDKDNECFLKNNIPEYIFVDNLSSGFNNIYIQDKDNIQNTIKPKYNSSKDFFIFETRQILSWENKEKNFKCINIVIFGKAHPFFSILTKSFVENFKIEKYAFGLRISGNIFGGNDYYIDAFKNNKLIAEKIKIDNPPTELQPIYFNAEIKTNPFGNIKAIIYEKACSDWFSFGYEEITSKEITIKNELSLLGKTVKIEYLIKDYKKSMFSKKYNVNNFSFLIKEEDEDDENIYYGYNNMLKIKLELIDNKTATVKFFDRNKNEYQEFFYNSVLKKLEQTKNLIYKSQYLEVTNDCYYYYQISIKE